MSDNMKQKQPTDRDADPAEVKGPDHGVAPGMADDKPNAVPDGDRLEAETAPLQPTKK